MLAIDNRAVGQPTDSSAALRPIDDARARSAGVRKLTSRHLELYTDLPSDPEVDRLPQVFDQAVRPWSEYFGVRERRARDWKARAFLIKDRTRFDALGLMPAGGNDQFVNGISMGPQLWLYDQPTPYYRRHLLLHEGTHVFMATLLGSCGPGWYMEGTAELMATHHLDEATGKLTLRVMPERREQVPMLGRIKLIEDAREAGRVLPLSSVMKIDNRRQLGNESYAWCWALAKFLDAHPRYSERFRRLRRNVLNPNFNNLFRAAYRDDWNELQLEWEAFVATLDHDYDFERMAIDFQRGTALEGPRRPRRVTIASDRGWQSSDVWLEAGKKYRVTASGRYQIAVEQNNGKRVPWPCEPGGVTIEYHDGRPLGMLVGAVVGEENQGAGDKGRGAGSGERGSGTRARAEPAAHVREVRSDFAHPMAIGLQHVFTPATSGTFYLRVNDSGGRLGDNRGDVLVVVEEVAE